MPYTRRIVEDWIETHSNEELVGSWRDPLFLIEEIVEFNPSLAWLIITLIIATDKQGDSLLDLIHGPLESWIFRHAPKSIELIEEEARDNERFKWALGGLVKPECADDIWERLEIARGGAWRKTDT